MRRFLAMAAKEMRQQARSPVALMMMLAAPLVITGVLFAAFGNFRTPVGFSLPRPRVLVVLEDARTREGEPTPASRLVDFLGSAAVGRYLDLLGETDAPAARAALAGRQADVVVDIPRGFSAGLQADARSAGGGVCLAARALSPRLPVQLIHDPAQTIGPEIVRAMLGQFLQGYAEITALLQDLDRRLTGRPEPQAGEARGKALAAYVAWSGSLVTDSERGVFPGIAVHQPAGTIAGRAPDGSSTGVGIITMVMAGMMLFFVFFTGLNGAATLLREKESGTLARLSTTGTPALALIGGKLAGTFALILIQQIVLLEAARLLFGADWGRTGTWAALLPALALAATGFGALVASLCRTVRQSGAVIGLVLTLTSLAGGLMTTGFPNPPALLRATARFIPQGWGLAAVLGAAAGRDTAELAGRMLLLAGFGLVTFAAGTGLFHRRLAREG